MFLIDLLSAFATTYCRFSQRDICCVFVFHIWLLSELFL